MTTLNRRTLLQSGAALALASSLTAEEAGAQTVVLRRSVGTMAPDDPILEHYREAIKAMKALGANDPLNWTKQAQIHLNHCPHGNWYFLPWHRAYLVAFERICRKLSKDPSFALPYWDWTANRQIPAAFTSPTYKGQANQLYDPSRTIPANYSFPDNTVGPGVISSLLAEPNFEVFGSSKPTGQNNIDPVKWQRAPAKTGPLEGNPHNRVHGTIGGNMGTYMSPLDPIFWMHHCNIDRLWQAWNDAGHANTGDSLWQTFKIDNNFVNPDGTPYNVTVSGMKDIVALGYRYTLKKLPPFHLNNFLLANKALPKQIQLDKLPTADKITINETARLNVAFSTPITLTPLNITALARVKPLDFSNLPSATNIPTAAARVVAIIGDVEIPKTGNADVRVFVNCDYLTPETPTADPSYAGTFSFFGGEHAEHQGKPSFFLDLTDAVTNLKRAQKEVGSQLNVQLMPVPQPGGAKEGVEFKPGYVQVAIV